MDDAVTSPTDPAVVWQPDVLQGFEATTVDLPDEDDGELVATVVRRWNRSSTCVIYVHGYSDYFFQEHLADSYLSAGIDFYAVDRRRCGRSLRPGNRPNYVDDIAHYGTELAAAVEIAVADGHDRVVLHGHSEGGLVSSIFAADHPAARHVDLLALNSPWLDVDLPFPQNLMWFLTRHLGHLYRYKALEPGLSAYVESIHSDLRGEWDFDLAWKPQEGVPLYPGWTRAVARAQARVHRGLGISMPVLVQHSDRSSRHDEWHPDLHRTDSVLSVDQIADRSSSLGPDVTIEVIAGGMHDLVLSPEPVRSTMLDQLQQWIRTRLASVS